VPALIWMSCGRTTAEAVQISVCTLMHVLEPDSEVGDCPSNVLHLYCLIEVHATNRVIACSLICNRNLACAEGTRLDCCDMTSAASEPGMAIITLDTLYIVFSCWLIPIDVTPMQHALREKHTAETRSHSLCLALQSHLRHVLGRVSD
jgi:hypothetical protein